MQYIALTCEPFFHRKIFWADLIGQLGSSNLDGSNRSVLLSDFTFRPYGLTLSPSTDRLYWFDSASGATESVK